MIVWLDPSLENADDWPRVPCVHALAGNFETRNFTDDNKLSLFSSNNFRPAGKDKHSAIKLNPWVSELFGGWAPFGPVVLAHADFDLPDTITPANYKEHLKIRPEWLKQFIEKQADLLQQSYMEWWQE